MAASAGAIPMPVVNHSLDHENRGIMMITLAAILLFFCLLIGGGRHYTRTYKLHITDADDVLNAASLFCTVTFDALLIVAAITGTGRHVWTLTPGQVRESLIAVFVSLHVYLCSLTFTKISLLLQYRRIFGRTWLNTVSAIVITFLAVWNVAQLILATLGCKPISILVPSMASNCLNMLGVWNTLAVVNVVTDLIIFLLPIWLVKSLQLPTKQKVLLSIVFGLGLFVCAISVSQLYFINTAPSADSTWNSAIPLAWSMVEANIAFYCSCITTLQPLLASIVSCLRKRFRGKLGSRLGTKTLWGTTGSITGTETVTGTASVIAPSMTTTTTITPWNTRSHSTCISDDYNPRKESSGTGYSQTSAWSLAKSNHTAASTQPLHDTVYNSQTIALKVPSTDAPGRPPSYAPAITPSIRVAGASAEDPAPWSSELEGRRLYNNQNAFVSSWVSAGPEKEDEHLLTMPSQVRTRSDDTGQIVDQLCLVEHITSDGDSSRHIVITRSTSPANQPWKPPESGRAHGAF